MTLNTKDYCVHPNIIPSWDNTARKGSSPVIYQGSTPALYSRWLNNICEVTKDKKEPLFFINAWNEWAEGAYLEPDKKYGYAYLEATKKVLKNYLRNKPNQNTPNGHHQSPQSVEAYEHLP